MTSTDPWCVMLYWLLTLGMGGAIKKTMDWLLQELRDGFLWIPAGDVAPRTKRRLTILVTALLPSAFYAAYSLWPITCEVYSATSHLTFVLAAFGVSQVWHGETKLATVPIVEVAIEPPHEIQDPQ